MFHGAYRPISGSVFVFEAFIIHRSSAHRPLYPQAKWNAILIATANTSFQLYFYRLEAEEVLDVDPKFQGDIINRDIQTHPRVPGCLKFRT